MERYLPTKPESNHQLLQRSFRLYKASIHQVFLLALLLSFLVFLPRITLATFGHSATLDRLWLSPNIIWQFVVNITAVIVFIAILWRIHGVTKSLHEPLREDFGVGLKKILWVFIASILQGVVVFFFCITVIGITFYLTKHQWIFPNNLIGAILIYCIFLAQALAVLYISMLFYFFVPLIAIENRGVFYALNTSVRLVWNHWWRVFSLQIIPWITYAGATILGKILLSLLPIHLLVFRTYVYWGILLNILLFSLIIPWVGTLLIIQLRELELRNKLIKRR